MRAISRRNCSNVLTPRTAVSFFILAFIPGVLVFVPSALAGASLPLAFKMPSSSR